jgi:hypothetical protein
MPLSNWRRCQERGELIYTRKDIEAGDDAGDVKAWEQIYDSYLLEFGLGKEYERILELRTDIALLECDLVIEEDNFIRNKIKRLERELKEILDRPVEIDTDGVLIALENWRGFSIDEDNTTVRKFYKLMIAYKKATDKKA